MTQTGTGADYEVMGTAELACPAIPYDEATGDPVVDAVAPLARSVCAATPGAGIAAVSPLPSTPWGEVIAVAAAATAAKGCRWAIFLEPVDSRPRGCAGYLLANGLGGVLARQTQDSRLLATEASLEILKQRVLRHGSIARSATAGSGSITHNTGLRAGPHNVGKARAGAGVAMASPGPPKPRARLLKNTPTVSGGCDLQAVQRALRRREAAFLKCYQQTLGVRSTVFQGDITLTFKLPLAGRPTQIKTPQVSDGLGQAAKCVRKVVQQMRIRPPKRSCRVQRVLRYRKALDPASRRWRQRYERGPDMADSSLGDGQKALFILDHSRRSPSPPGKVVQPPGVGSRPGRSPYKERARPEGCKPFSNDAWRHSSTAMTEPFQSRPIEPDGSVSR